MDLQTFAGEPSELSAPRFAGSAPPTFKYDAVVSGLRDLSARVRSWRTASNAKRDLHGLFQYPAMMVPRIQGEILDVFARARRSRVSLLDPFAGSGTIAVEAARRGFHVRAQDINPLALLLCLTKRSRPDQSRLAAWTGLLFERIHRDRASHIEAKFPGLHKWYSRRAIDFLSRARRGIREAIEDRNARFFYWTCLAETARILSHSRTSTYKLHARPESDFDQHPPPSHVFQAVLDRNLALVGDYYQHYDGSVEVRYRDARTKISGSYQLMMTSPPYGDGTSTVPYGQAAYLPLQWVDLDDLGMGSLSVNLRTTQEMDRRSLGGTAPDDLSKATARLETISSACRPLFRALRSLPPDRLRRVTSFLSDLATSLEHIVGAMTPNSWLAWTIGNRRVGGEEVPLHRILTDMLAMHRVTLVHSFYRPILKKRMAHRNARAPTMTRERIMVFHKGSDTNRDGKAK